MSFSEAPLKGITYTKKNNPKSPLGVDPGGLLLFRVF